MDIINFHQQQIEQLEMKRNEILSMADELPDAAFYIFQINAQIRDAMMRGDRLKTEFSPRKCNQCKQSIKEEITDKIQSKLNICSRCLQTIRGVVTNAEIEEKLKLKNGTVKNDINYKLKPLVGTSLIRKSNKIWLIHKSVTDMFYNPNFNKNEVRLNWIGEMEERVQSLRKRKEILTGMKDALNGAILQLFSLDSQIKDYEDRLSIVTGDRYPFRCSLCKGWVKGSDKPLLLQETTICHHCTLTMEQVKTFGEIEEILGLRNGRIHKDKDKGVLEPYLNSKLLWKSGSIWLFHLNAARLHYKPEDLKPEEPAYNAIPTSLMERSKAIYQKIQEEKSSTANG
ncbi:MAG: hypothetical protein ACE3L7_33670 [Candidatus Pristimantibacillus sp.]